MTRKDKQSIQEMDLDEEIEMLRKALRQTFQLAQQVDDPEEKLRALAALGTAAARLGNLVKIQRQLNPGRGSEMDERIKAALEEAARELGVEE